MDVVDLDKVLDDFEFNEENSEAPKCTLHREPNEIKNNIIITNNNDFEFPQSGTTTNNGLTTSINNANNPNDTTSTINVSASKSIALAYPIKNNVNVANVFTSLIEYINAGSDQTAQHSQTENVEVSSEVQAFDESNELFQVVSETATTPLLEYQQLESEQPLKSQDEIVDNPNSIHSEESTAPQKAGIENHIISDTDCKDKERFSLTVSVDSDTDDDISEQDSGSLQTSLSYTADNQGVKVIGFNSTMDDISDAELESYLQQIEIEHSHVELYDSSEPDVKVNAMSAKCSRPSENGTYLDSTNSEYGLYTIDTENIVNYDSISQASTVEIIDAQNSTSSVPEQANSNHSESMNKLSDIDTNDSDLCSSTNTDKSVINLPEDHIIPHPKDLNIPPFTLDFQITSAGQTPMNADKTFEESITSPTSSLGDVGNNEQKFCEDESSNHILPPSQDGEQPHVTPNISEGDNPTNKNESKDFPQQTDTNEEPIPLHLLGKIAPYWIPDHVSSICMQCNLKFTVIKRRHHCRACGQVLCSKCCCMKAKLCYLGNSESRVCLLCFEYLTNNCDEVNNSPGAVGGTVRGSDRPNPNNPMEYCSVIPPLQQVSNTTPSPISVMVPVGVLKREGSQKGRSEKTVMFSDGIRPGSDLTKLDHSWDSTDTSATHKNTDLVQRGDKVNKDTNSET